MLLRLPLGLAIVFGFGGAVALAGESAGPAAKAAPAGKAVKLEIPGTKAPAVEIGLGKANAEGQQGKRPEPVPTAWSQAELAAATARCNALLKNVDAVVIPEAPFRKGACGAAAPMRVIAVGKNPEIALNPPPVLSCDMIAALAAWLKADVQPLAKKHLGAPVIRIDTMSDYSCRAAYGRAGNRLSEHARANALDIRGFVTAKGQGAVVLADWGKTARDVRREIAAAEKAEKARAAASGAAPVAQQPAPAPVQAAAQAPKPPAAPSTVEELAAGALDAVTSIVKSTIVDGVSKAPDREGHALAEPNRLGGPKEEPQPAPASASRKSRFLREAHASACRIFGTTLGPEANEPHRNHFHIDMAERKSRRFCE